MERQCVIDYSDIRGTFLSNYIQIYFGNEIYQAYYITCIHVRIFSEAHRYHKIPVYKGWIQP